MFPDDLIKLKRIGKSDSDFVEDIIVKEKPVKVLKKKSNSTCVFWDEEKKGCSIYQSRPFDCKMFPFDIRLINNEYHWIVFSCNPDSDWQWTEDYLQKLENDPQFADIIENIETYSSFIVSRIGKIDPLKFTVLRKIRSISVVLSHIN